MTTRDDRLVEDFLGELDQQLAEIPRARRRELVGEIAQHIADGRAAAPDGEAEVRALLDRLGEPAEIAAEARERLGVEARPRPATVDVVALVLLFPGSVLIPVLGWIAAVVVLSMSTAWSARDKVIGALGAPAGAAVAVVLVAAGRPLASVVPVVVVPAALTAGYLWWRLRRRG
jgi:uncharacterized membrane protein